MNRGDVVLAFYPFTSGSGGKRRPGRIVQNDQRGQDPKKRNGS